MLTSRKGEEACNLWWEESAEQAERMHEEAVKNGWGGSLIRSLRVLQSHQKVRSSIALKAANGADVVPDVPGKLYRWHKHF